MITGALRDPAWDWARQCQVELQRKRGSESATTSRPDVTCAEAPAALATGALLSLACSSKQAPGVWLPERNPLQTRPRDHRVPFARGRLAGIHLTMVHFTLAVEPDSV